MRRIVRYWQVVPAAVRKPLILIFGSTIVIVGLAMLVLPGPGWVVIFIGFALLATEFAFAEKVRDWLMELLKSAGRRLKKFFNRIMRKAR